MANKVRREDLVDPRQMSREVEELMQDGHMSAENAICAVEEMFVLNGDEVNNLRKKHVKRRTSV